MSELSSNQNPNKKKPDLFHLDNFLQESLAGFSDKSKENDFDTETFFDSVIATSELKQFPDHQTLSSDIANRLDEYVPQLYEAMDKKGCEDREKIGFLSRWAKFLIAEKIDPDRIVDTVIGHSDNWISSNRSKTETVFLLYESAISSLANLGKSDKKSTVSPLDKISDNSKGYIADFISEYSRDALCRYATMATDGLDHNVSKFDKTKKGRDNHFESYAADAVTCYGQGIQLLMRVASKEAVHYYGKEIAPQMHEATRDSMQGYWYVDTYDNYHETLIPDMRTQTSCLVFSLQALRKYATKTGFFKNVYDYVPEMMTKNVEWYDPDSCCELFRATSKLFLPDTEEQKTFARAFGTRAIAGMAEKYPEHAASLLVDIRDLLQINKDDVLILTDPQEINKIIPVAASAKAPHESYEDAEHDLVLLFQNVSDVLLRDNLRDEPEFSSLLDQQKTYDDFKIIINVVNEAKNMSLQNPEVTHYGDYLHSYPMKLLVQKPDQ